MADPELAREQQAAQIGLIVLLQREIAQTLPELDVRRLTSTLPAWIRAIHRVLGRFGQMSGGLALDYYDNDRALAGITGAGPSPLLTEPDLEQLDVSMRWATKNLWSEDVRDNAGEVHRYLQDAAGRAAERAAADERANDWLDEDLFDLSDEELAAGLAELGGDDLDEEQGEDLDDFAGEPPTAPERDDRDASRAVEEARVVHSKVNGITNRIVFNIGRTAVVEAVEEDRRAVGWARVGRVDACAFCRMMAIRGVVYKTAGTAGRDTDSRFAATDTSGTFKYHNGCRCWAVPYFEGEEWDPQPQIELWEAQYRQARAMPGDIIANFYAIVHEAERNQ